MPYLERPIEQVGFSRSALAAFGQAPTTVPAGPLGPLPPHGVTMAPQRVYKMTLPADPEQASMVSLHYIHELVRDGREDPLVRRRAFEIIRQAGVRERDYSGMIRAIHQWIQRHVRYEHDPAGVEFLTQARVLLDQVDRGEAFEDCDSFVLLEHALLNSVGVPTRSVIIAADARAPQQWSHIFLEAFDNRRKQWVTLDPIMKNKPIGWHPPKYHRKRVVPVADGPAQFPPRNGIGQLPPGMTVEMLPVTQSRATAAAMFAGTVGGWHGAGRSGWGSWGGFSGYGAEPEACRWKGTLEQGHDWLEWAVQQVADVVTRAGVRPQGMEPRAWALHMSGIDRGQIGQWQIDAAASRPGGASLLFGRALLGSTAHWLTTMGHAAAATELQAAATFAEACAQGRAGAAQAAEPAQILGRLQRDQRELAQMRSEALSYVVPVLDSTQSLLPLAEHHMGRLADRQKFLKSVNEIATWTSRVLSMLGPVTGGITEVLSIAIQLGNLGYQMRQAGRLATGSAATVLTNIGASFEQADALVRAVQEVAKHANDRMGRVQTQIDAVLAQHPELAQGPTEALQVGPASTFPLVPVVGAAAALLILATVL